MQRASRSLRLRSTVCFALVAATGLLPLAGCGGDDKKSTPPSGGSTGFVGTFSGSNESGYMTATVATDSPAPARITGAEGAQVNATGTIKITGGATHSLTGSYDTASNLLALSGGGFTFGGTLANNLIEGNYIGPTAGGDFRLLNSTAAGVKVYCGTYQSSGAGGSGTFNLVISGSVISGLATTSGGEIALDGTLTGADITIVNPDNPQGPPLATGTVSGNNVSGTYDNGSGDSGTWSGSICQ